MVCCMKYMVLDGAETVFTLWIARYRAKMVVICCQLDDVGMHQLMREIHF